MSEALNVTKAAFGGLREVTTSPLWQYDYGQILQITGLDLPQAFEVHFSNSRKSGETITQIGTDGQVTIPDMFLTSGADIYCFVFLHDGLTDGETEYVIKIPVRERPEPSDIEPTPEQQDAITQAIAALNTAVTQTGEDKEATAALAEAAAASSLIATEAAQSAQASATSASGSASTASTAADTATQKASEAATSAANAANAKTAAETAQGKAEAAQTAAESAQASAESAANTATSKASEASTSASNASGSASAASASASQASESATNAAASATAASGSATSAATSATTASTKASEAAQSEANTIIAKNAAEAAQTAAETAAATFETDTTLTVSGKAADAKAVGDKISEIDNGNIYVKDVTESQETVTIENPSVISGVSFDIVATQEGTGAPSPTNVRTIVGKSNAILCHSGADTSTPDEITISAGTTLYKAHIDTEAKLVTEYAKLIDLSQLSWSIQYYQSTGDYLHYVSLSSIGVKEKASSASDFFGLCDRYAFVSYNTLVASADINKAAVRNDNNAKRLYIRTASEDTDPTGYALLELATPTTGSIPEVVITPLTGINKLWIDEIKISVAYKTLVKTYVDDVKNANSIKYDPTTTYSGGTVGAELTEQTELLTTIYTDIENWSQGYWGIADGKAASGAAWVRSCQTLDFTVATIKTVSPYKLILLAYSEDTYIGAWMGNGWTTTYDSTYISRYIDLVAFRKAYPNYIFRLDVTKESGNISPTECANNVVVRKLNDRKQNNAIKVILGKIDDKTFWENGTINSSGAKGVDSNFYKRLSTICYMNFPFPVTIIPKDGYTISVTTYNGDKTFVSQFSAWSTNPFTFAETDKLYKVVIKAANNSVIVPSGISSYIETKWLRATPFDRVLSGLANVKAVNHRGYNFVAPENTIIAYEMSAALGYKYVETDVLFTSDGVPVLLHDETINRTARNADGTALSSEVYIENITYAEALTYDFGIYKGEQFAGTKIPTFEEFMYCCKALNLHPWIELKHTHTYTLEEVQEIISIIKQYGMEEHVSFISFSYAALALVASEWDTVELGLNGTIANAELLKTGKNRVFMIYSSSSSYTDAISAGFQVCVYTIDSTATLSNLSSQGFDSILTNGLLQSQVNDVVYGKYNSTIQRTIS